jgi:hypothetical protein
VHTFPHSPHERGVFRHAGQRNRGNSLQPGLAGPTEDTKPNCTGAINAAVDTKKCDNPATTPVDQSIAKVGYGTRCRRCVPGFITCKARRAYLVPILPSTARAKLHVHIPHREASEAPSRQNTDRRWDSELPSADQ